MAKLLVQRHFDGLARTGPGDEPDVFMGTGWLLGPCLLITNHHVVNARDSSEPPASASDFSLQAKSTQAQFDYYRTDSPGSMVAALECVAFDAELDYAVLRLTDLAKIRTPLRLRINPIIKPKELALRERVNVLQHPGGHPMRLGFRNNFVVAGAADRISYLTDTSGGSSGSPICDDAWHVAALHRGWRIIAPAPVSVWGKEISQENYGTPINCIMEHLAQHFPEVHHEVLIGQENLVGAGLVADGQ